MIATGFLSVIFIEILSGNIRLISARSIQGCSSTLLLNLARSMLSMFLWRSNWVMDKISFSKFFWQPSMVTSRRVSRDVSIM